MHAVHASCTCKLCMHAVHASCACCAVHGNKAATRMQADATDAMDAKGQTPVSQEGSHPTRFPKQKHEF
eukprot:1160436-Pelagomonas_calceolata.AAC.3